MKQYRRQTQHWRMYRSGRAALVNRGIRYRKHSYLFEEGDEQAEPFYIISNKPFGKVVYANPGKAYVIEITKRGMVVGSKAEGEVGETDVKHGIQRDNGLESLEKAKRLADSAIITYGVRNFGADPIYKAKNRGMFVYPDHYIPAGSKDKYGQEEGYTTDSHSGIFNFNYKTSIEGYKDLDDAILSAEDVITLQAPWGQHIPLRCKKDGKIFSTKNIGGIGARSIFPKTVDCEHGIEDLELAEDLLSEWDKPIESREQAKKLIENIRAKNTLLMNLREGALKPQLVARGFTREEIDRMPLHIIEGVISERNDASELKRIPQDILDKFVSKGLLPKEYQSGGI